MLSAVAVAFGTRELLAPVTGGHILFQCSLEDPTVSQGRSNTAHPTKPISVSACHLPFPTVCCLQKDLAATTAAPDGAL